jgi:hypothetical protein
MIFRCQGLLFYVMYIRHYGMIHLAKRKRGFMVRWIVPDIMIAEETRWIADVF